MSKSSPTNPPLDREAKRRLAVIRHVEEVTGNVAMSCRYFGISRQAYYTWYRRYQAEGVEGLRTRSKAPKTCPNATHVEVVGKIISPTARWLRRVCACGRARWQSGRWASPQATTSNAFVRATRSDSTRTPHGQLRRCDSLACADSAVPQVLGAVDVVALIWGD
ncbi:MULTISPECIES: leucine zipper domain-containing protein [unclassified Streptomyces]|uniref:helix-turn-helix domain-containing protein n=1 Tax=unclassified Streptomyces TaxID=2593676 RepID=UPI001CED5A2F|nr:MULTISPECIES: leucine zipper domain-containing protein [unclassified Streptomyces]